MVADMCADTPLPGPSPGQRRSCSALFAQGAFDMKWANLGGQLESHHLQGAALRSSGEGIVYQIDGPR